MLFQSIYSHGFLGGPDSKESTCNAGDLDQSLGWEDPLEGMATTLVFFPGEFHGQRNLAGYSPWGCKESDRLRNYNFHF